jgi:hypothetical protein
MATPTPRQIVDGPLEFVRVGAPPRPGNFEVHSPHGGVLARFRQEHPSGAVAVIASFGMWGLFRYGVVLEDGGGGAILRLVRPKRHAFVQASGADGHALGRIVLGRRIDGHGVQALDPEGRRVCSSEQKTGLIFHDVPHTIVDEHDHSIAEVVPDLVAPRHHGHVSRFDVIPSSPVETANAWVVLSWLPALALIDPKQH